MPEFQPSESFVNDITLDQLEDDPYPIYARLRAEAPVAWIPAAAVWFVTRFADCEAVGNGQEGFVGAKDHPTLQRVFGTPNVLTATGETHKQLRQGVDPRLQPRPVAETVDAVVRPIARQRLADIRRKGGGDLMANYLEPVSVEALRHVIGLDDLVDAGTLRRWFHDLNVGVSNFGLDPGGFALADAASAEIERVIAPKLAHLVAHPDDSMLSHMLWAGREPGAGPRTMDFIMPSLRVILLGGMQEPGHAAGSTLLGLFSRPEQWRMLVEDPDEYIPRAVNEGLRWIAPIGAVERQASRDCVVNGRHIPAGSIVQVVLASANRDATRFEDPDSFDMLRNSRPHQAFGNGAHFCAGHIFARQVECVMFQEMVAALKGLRPDESKRPEISGWVFRAPKYLPVEWDAPEADRIAVTVSARPFANPRRGSDTRVLVVRAVRRVADAIVSLDLADPEGRPLPAWSPGAHVDLWLDPDRAGQYSLCGDPSDPILWRIAVFREPQSRGMSRRVHDVLKVGMRVHVGGPRNHFELQPAACYLFVAGGIGITPILPMARAAARQGTPAELVYCGRSRAAMAFLEELHETALEVTIVARDEGPRADLDAIVRRARDKGAAIYACGPETLLHELGDAGARHAVDIVSERFTGGQAHRDDDVGFDVVLARSGQVHAIPANRTILEVLDEAGFSIRRSCQEGNCGSCETLVVGGLVDHRDMLLTPRQRAANDRLLVCVSRSADGQPLVLDL